MLKEHFDFSGYKKFEKTMSVDKATNLALFLLSPLAVFCFVLYSSVWKIFNNISWVSISLCILYIAVLTFSHELTHGAVLKRFCEDKRSSIKYGIKSFVPYCHCKEILSVAEYRTVCAMPLLVTGIFPFIIALLTGHNPLAWASFLSVLGAGGDYAILLMLIREKRTAFVEDHPALIGCIVYRPNENK